MPPLPPAPRRRGRPPKRRSQTAEPTAADPRPSEAGPGSEDGDALLPGGPVATDRPEATGDAAVDTSAAPAPPAAPARRRRDSAPSARPSSRRDALTIEAIVAIEPPREFRLHPRERIVAFTSEAAGARQLFTMSLRAGVPVQVTASEKPVSDPQWSPDGRRLAFVRDGAIRMVEIDGSRETAVTEHPAGNTQPRWSPDGRQIAFLSRRRGWSQVWLVEAPVPRRGRPRRDPRPPEPRPITATGLDIDAFAWSPDGASVAVMSRRSPELDTHQVHVVDVATGDEHQVAGNDAWETAASWVRDGSLLLVSDASGWFQVLHVSADLRERALLTAGEREHGEPTGAPGYAPLASPDGSRFAHVEVKNGYVGLMVAPLGPAAPVKRGPGRPPKVPRTVSAVGAAVRLDPWPGVWRIVDWLHDGSALLAVGESEGRPQDLWLLPVPERGGKAARPRQITRSLPIVLESVLGSKVVPGERVAMTARDGLRLEGTLWRPPTATGRRGGTRVPAIVYPHGGPTWQAFRRFDPFKQLLVREGFAVLDVDFRGSTGYGRDFRRANHGEWGHADAHDILDAAHWLEVQSWCDGRLAVWGGSYGGYLVLCALVEEPGIWRAGIDLYGDSEIAESYRRGDRPGRLDLERQMGRPDDPEREPLYRRGSPVYRAERIEAPLLILHGCRDKRVVPLMSEKMVEALEIEGKHHEVVYYDDEAHGWERRETRRDAYTRTLDFLRRHVLDDTTGT
jgi:dipeptidyl aminopeptidase/acylaminoacyl peptidase